VDAVPGGLEAEAEAEAEAANEAPTGRGVRREPP